MSSAPVDRKVSVSRRRHRPASLDASRSPRHRRRCEAVAHGPPRSWNEWRDGAPNARRQLGLPAVVTPCGAEEWRMRQWAALGCTESVSDRENFRILLGGFLFTSLAELQDTEMQEWLLQMADWVSREKFRYLALCHHRHTAAAFTPSLEQQDQANRLALMHLRILGALQTMPWWRLVSFTSSSAEASCIDGPRSGGDEEPAGGGLYRGWFSCFLPQSPQRASLHSCALIRSAAPSHTVHTQMQMLQRCGLRIQLALERLCMVCLSQSIHTLKGVLEVLMKPFGLRAPGKDGLPRQIPIHSMARVLSQIAQQCYLQRQAAPPAVGGVSEAVEMPPLLPYTVTSLAFEVPVFTGPSGLYVRVVKELLEQCILKWLPKLKWPDVTHHVAGTALFLHLALEDTIPASSTSPVRWTFMDEHQQENRDIQEGVLMGNNEIVQRATALVYQLFHSVREQGDAALHEGASSSSGSVTPPLWELNYMKEHSNLILHLLFQRLRLMELSLEKRRLPAPEPTPTGFASFFPASPVSQSKTHSFSVGHGARAPLFHTTRHSEELCALVCPLSSAYLEEARQVSRAVPRRQDDESAQSRSEALVRLFSFPQYPLWETYTVQRWRNPAEKGGTALPQVLLDMYTESSKSTAMILECCSALVYAKLAEDLARLSMPVASLSAAEGETLDSRVLESTLSFPQWWPELLHRHFDVMRQSSGPVCLVYIVPALLQFYTSGAARLVEESPHVKSEDSRLPSWRNKEWLQRRQRMGEEEAINILHRLVSLVLKGYYMPTPAMLRTGSHSTSLHTAGKHGSTLPSTSGTGASSDAAHTHPHPAPSSGPSGAVPIRMAPQPAARGSSAGSAPPPAATAPLSVSERIRLAHYIFPLFKRLHLHGLHRAQDALRRQAGRSGPASGNSSAVKTAAEVLLRRLIKWCRIHVPKEIPQATVDGAAAVSAMVGPSSPLFASPTMSCSLATGPPELAAVVWAQAMAMACAMDAAVFASIQQSPPLEPTPTEASGAAPPTWSMLSAIWTDQTMATLVRQFGLTRDTANEGEGALSSLSGPGGDSGVSEWPQLSSLWLNFEQMEEAGLLRLTLLEACPWPVPQWNASLQHEMDSEELSALRDG